MKPLFLSKNNLLHLLPFEWDGVLPWEFSSKILIHETERLDKKISSSAETSWAKCFCTLAIKNLVSGSEQIINLWDIKIKAFNGAVRKPLRLFNIQEKRLSPVLERQIIRFPSRNALINNNFLVRFLNPSNVWRSIAFSDIIVNGFIFYRR